MRFVLLALLPLVLAPSAALAQKEIPKTLGLRSARLATSHPRHHL